MSAAHDTQFGVVERRGIELVPESERHGKPRDLFFVWVAANANVFSIVNGALLISLGLNFLQSVAVIVLGNIFGFFLLGLTSIQGPRTGTATFTINRAAYGHNGGRLLAFFNWLTLVGWDSSGVALMVIALLTLTHVLGWSISNTTWFKVAVILFVAVVQLSIPALGHATIMVVQKILSWVFVFCFLLVALMLAGKAQLIGGQTGTFATMTLGFALIVSAGGISWASTGSDYSRYLPKAAPPGAIIWAASLGGMLPAILLQIVGAAVATKLPGASDPISGLPSTLPAWFLAPYMLLIFFNLLSSNVVNLYSSGLNVQTIGLSLKRWQATLIDMVICTMLAAIAIFNANFNALYSQFLSLMILLLAPWCAIYLTDAWLRRNTYDATGLLARVGGPYWYWGGFNPAGLLAMIGGVVASALWLNSSLLQGPLSHLFGGSDMSIFTGFLVGGILYWILVRVFMPQLNPAHLASYVSEVEPSEV
jgi:nucleobase:cation symporter-1, NCS1 family